MKDELSIERIEGMPGISKGVVIRNFLIPLSGGGIAVVKIPVPMSESDFDQLTGTLNAWKAALVWPDDKTQGGRLLPPLLEIDD